MGRLRSRFELQFLGGWAGSISIASAGSTRAPGHPPGLPAPASRQPAVVILAGLYRAAPRRPLIGASPFRAQTSL
jgi:hypothetical protein